jgi:hypothetical protein
MSRGKGKLVRRQQRGPAVWLQGAGALASGSFFETEEYSDSHSRGERAGAYSLKPVSAAE